MASVSVRRTPGCPRNRQPALTAETNQDGFYDVDRLVRPFLRQPGQPLQGRVMDELSLSSTTDETRAFIGVVVALHLADGVYKWSVRFEDGRLQDYEAERLAQAVNRARNCGARVTI
ncbi:hypothetical protein PI124_g11518 [Phytophthora idaei]|nr:hypothetical protein PI125_g11023 [Phytophthora idaei]KAG3154569.1 hypothetical protein PI126_g9563 [Phytophthora idaei]KAG3243675.1 hypothetical protein PI124_g11518 [Phytophthora idaei]